MQGNNARRRIVRAFNNRSLYIGSIYAQSRAAPTTLGSVRAASPPQREVGTRNGLEIGGNDVSADDTLTGLLLVTCPVIHRYVIRLLSCSRENGVKIELGRSKFRREEESLRRIFQKKEKND